MTREERIQSAAHVWSGLNDAMFWGKVQKLGLDAEEIREALRLAKAQAEEYENWRRQFGSPEAGGWRRDKRDNRNKPAQVIPEEFRQ